MSLISEALKSASGVANAILGVLCYYTSEDGDVTDATIIIERNKPVRDNFGIIAGYHCEASILKSEICEQPKAQEFFENSETGEVWKITQVTKQTSSKWYVDIIELHDGNL